MRTLTLVAASGIALALATPAFAERGGDRVPAGGPLNSSYSNGPYQPDGRYPNVRIAPDPSFSAWGREPVATGSVGTHERSRRAR